MHAPRPRFVRTLLTLGLGIGLVAGGACDSAPAPAKAKEADAPAKADGEGRGGGAKAAAGEVPSAVKMDEETRKAVAQFTKDQRKKSCEMLTPAMVAEVLEVPEGELEQKKIMGCIYTWKGGGQEAQASLMSIWIKKTPESARTWFENMTKTQTKEELAEQMKQVTAKAKEREEIDTKLKKKTVDQVGGLAAAMTPDEGYRYEDVEGIGDAARVQTYDSSVTVLMGNMVFGVRAFKGEPQPPIDPQLIMTRDIKKITAASKESERVWFDETRDVRRAQSIALAKAIVAKL